MPKRTRKKVASAPARPIRNKRDYQGASGVVTHLSVQAKRTATEEQRLQALLTEMDKFDDGGDSVDADLPEADDYSGPQRRWSDDASGAE